MKKVITLLVLVMSSFAAKAGGDGLVNAFLFPEFEKGYVVLKSNGARLQALLNYDMVSERMIYIDSESTLIELDTKSVVLVTIGERSFVPMPNRSFYEVIKSGNNEYFISHKSKIMSKGKSAGYGSYSQTSAITSMAHVQGPGYLSYIGYDEKFEGVDQSAVLIRNDKKYEKITSLKSLFKSLKQHQTALETFAKDNKVRFGKIEDVISIVEYAFSL